MGVLGASDSLCPSLAGLSLLLLLPFCWWTLTPCSWPHTSPPRVEESAPLGVVRREAALLLPTGVDWAVGGKSTLNEVL